MARVVCERINQAQIGEPKEQMVSSYEMLKNDELLHYATIYLSLP